MPHAGGATMAMGAWAAMMVLMMLPSLSPVLWRYHRALAAMGAPRPAGQTMLFCIAYVAVWSMASAIMFELAAVSGVMTQWGTPLVTGVVIVAAGILQLTTWKARHLAHCRDACDPNDSPMRSRATACRDGARFGAHCTLSCAGYTATILAIGAMDLRAMLAMTAVITAERAMPPGTRVARTAGAVAVLGGLMLLEHAVLAGV